MTSGPFTESLRYEYPLTSQSLVIDAGCYEGNWAKTIHGKYGCRVDAYEPVASFFENCCKNLRGLDKIRMYNFGVCALQGGKIRLHIQNDSSGAFAGSDVVEDCSFLPIAEIVRIAGVRRIDLIKLNVEGMEYDIMEALLISKDPFGPSIRRFANLQIQFHQNVPEFEQRYAAIAGDLSHTHECTWREPFVWENWRMK